MAAQIESMAFFGATPWHGLGTPLEEADLFTRHQLQEKLVGLLSLKHRGRGRNNAQRRQHTAAGPVDQVVKRRRGNRQL